MYKKGFSKSDIRLAGYFQHPDVIQLTDSDFNQTVENYISDFCFRTCKKEINIVVFTGCFNPLHNGHTYTLEAARKHIKTLNNNPIMCILSPAHDEYSSSKINNTGDIHSRIVQMKDFMNDNHHSYVNVVIDSFAATKYSTDVNFTYIIERYEEILKQLSVNAKIFFVYGSDNAEFGYVLATNNINGICVKRTDDDSRMCNVIATLKSKKCNYKLIHNEFDNPHSTLNSTSIRSRKKTYFIRNDLKYALPNVDEETRNNYADTITNAFNQVFEGSDVSIKVIDIDSQMVNIERSSNVAIISLDKFYRGDFNLNISRVFTPNTFQDTADSFYVANEKDFVSYITQAKKDGIESFIIVDDDKSTGRTSAYVKHLIESNYTKLPSIQFKYLIEIHVDYNEYSIYDIVDMRDFVCGSLYGGLLCRVASKYRRFMYYSPEVNLATRAKIPSNKIKAFVEAMVKMNNGKIYE